MDSERRKWIIVGIVIFFGIAIFVFGIFKVGSHNGLFRDSYVINVQFPDASGLKEGSIVRFNGVNAGIVKSVNLINDTAVLVKLDIEVEKQHLITEYAQAVIVSDGLMGDKMIRINSRQRGGKPVPENGYIKGYVLMSTDQLMQTLDESNRNVKEITYNLKVFTHDLNTGNGTMQRLLKDSMMGAEFDRLITNINAASTHVLMASTKLNRFSGTLDAPNSVLGRMTKDTVLGRKLENTFQRLNMASTGLDSVSSQLMITMQKVNYGNGTVSRLLSDSVMSSDINESVKNIKKASEQLNQNLEAMRHNILFRGYFKKQKKQKR